MTRSMPLIEMSASTTGGRHSRDIRISETIAAVTKLNSAKVLDRKSSTSSKRGSDKCFSSIAADAARPGCDGLGHKRLIERTIEATGIHDALSRLTRPVDSRLLQWRYSAI